MNGRRLFRHPDGARPSLLALGYAVGAWAGGLITLVLAAHWALLAVGTLLLAHGMVIAAYLVHECAHNAVFTRGEHNARLGRALKWITGTCYSRYDDVRRKHLRHHVDNAEIIAFDPAPFLERRPRLLRAVQALEWAYLPAVELLMHAAQWVVPFVLPSRRHERGRVLAILALRGGAFGLLAWFAPVAALLYALAYLIMLTVLRFMDAFQHNYLVFETLEEGDSKGASRRGDAAYEQAHTFSNPISRRVPALNLLTLNFAYHNAHHARPTEPWFRLPRLHRELFEQPDDGRVIGLREQLRAFHRHRVPRVLGPDAGAEDFGPRMQRGEGTGWVGVSFLIGF